MKYRIQTELIFDVDANSEDDAKLTALLQLGMGDIGNDDITYLNVTRIREGSSEDSTR